MIQETVVNNIARNYNTLNFPLQLQQLLSQAFPKKDFQNYTKRQLHSNLNDLIMNNYSGETIHKYMLASRFKAQSDVVGAFEIKANNSRVDFLAINGISTSFEIKSCLDNLNKIEKQIEDYQKVFEYNYLLLDIKHLENAKKIIPQSIGIWVYENGEHKKIRNSEYSTKLDPVLQLSLLSKKEIRNAFGINEKNIEYILTNYDSEVINNKFKETLKVRYKNQWNFIVNNQKKILPIDIQFFFSQNIDPRAIYKC